MGRTRKARRNQHGSAWHWKQTDCWYYTLPGTKKRMPLFDESGERVRGKDNQRIAEHALARAKLAGEAIAREVWPIVDLVATDERIFDYRHQIIGQRFGGSP